MIIYKQIVFNSLNELLEHDIILTYKNPLESEYQELNNLHLVKQERSDIEKVLTNIIYLFNKHFIFRSNDILIALSIYICVLKLNQMQVSELVVIHRETLIKNLKRLLKLLNLNYPKITLAQRRHLKKLMLIMKH